VRTVKEGLEAAGEDFAMLVMPDHPTPLYCRTHTSDPVPYVLYRSYAPEQHAARIYSEQEAAATGIFVPQGYTMMDKLIKG
jgi:2,3-bisphosphoglycerate-independent phosphoglycerate mutase